MPSRAASSALSSCTPRCPSSSGPQQQPRASQLRLHCHQRTVPTSKQRPCPLYRHRPRLRTCTASTPPRAHRPVNSSRGPNVRHHHHRRSHHSWTERLLSATRQARPPSDSSWPSKPQLTHSRQPRQSQRAAQRQRQPRRRLLTREPAATLAP